MNIAQAFKDFATFLSERPNLVKSRDVLVENWDPTYGRQDPSTETIEVVDMHELIKAIDEFGEQLRERHGKEV